MSTYNGYQWFVIVNPNAGKGAGSKNWLKIKSLIEKESIQIAYQFTQKKSDAKNIAIEAISKGHRKLICVGGDGTLNEIINGIMTQKYCPSSEISIGLIPVGTGNDWGKMFDIPNDYEGAINVIRKEKKFLHDIAIIDHFNESRKERNYFINIAGLGFEAKVIQKTNRQKEKGRRNGKAIYLINLLTCLFTNKNKEVTITIDDEIIKQKVFSINLGNGKYCGGGMRQTPEAIPNDGLLDITVIGDLKKIEVINSLRSLYDGTILDHPKINGYRAKKITVESSPPIFSEADGETFGHTPIEFSVIREAVTVYIN